MKQDEMETCWTSCTSELTAAPFNSLNSVGFKSSSMTHFTLSPWFYFYFFKPPYYPQFSSLMFFFVSSNNLCPSVSEHPRHDVPPSFLWIGPFFSKKAIQFSEPALYDVTNGTGTLLAPLPGFGSVVCNKIIFFPPSSVLCRREAVNAGLNVLVFPSSVVFPE